MQNSFKNFTIVTQHKEYKSELYAVHSLKVIRVFFKEKSRSKNEDKFE